MADFQIKALPAATFQELFDLSDAELAKRGAVRQTVTAKPGAPCRISLKDAEVGEDVILANFEHVPAPSPYRARHAVYVRKGAQEALPAVNEVPALFTHRLMGLRAYDADHMMVACDVMEGTELKAALSTLFEDPQVATVHLHNAKPGCYAAKATRK